MGGETTRQASRQEWHWVAYLAAVIFAGAGLTLAERREPGTDVRTGDVRGRTPVLAVRADSETPSSRVSGKFVATLADQDTWQRSARRYLDRIGGTPPEPWVAPPAGRPVVSEVLLAQSRAASGRPIVARVVFTPLGQGGGDELQITAGAYKAAAGLADRSEFFVPLQPAVRDVEVTVVSRGFFGRSTLARGTISASVLLADGERDIELAPLRFAVRSKILPRDDPKNTLALATNPRKLEPKDGLIVHDGVVGELGQHQDLVIDTGDRFTAIIVQADAPIEDVVRVVRLDTQAQVGAYASAAPIVAAMADKRAPVLVHVSGGGPRGVKYRVVAVARDTDPTADLMLTYLGGHLMQTTIDGLPVSDAQARTIVNWLTAIFGVRLGSAEVNAIRDKTARRIAETFAQPTSVSVPPGAAKQ